MATTTHLPPRRFYILLVWCSSFLICSLLSCLLSSSLHLPDHSSNQNYQRHNTISAAILLMLAWAPLLCVLRRQNKKICSVDLSLFALHLQVFNSRCCHHIPTTSLYVMSSSILPHPSFRRWNRCLLRTRCHDVIEIFWGGVGGGGCWTLWPHNISTYTPQCSRWVFTKK